MGCLSKQRSAFAGDRTMCQHCHSALLPVLLVAFVLLSHKCYHINSPWVGIRRKINAFTQRGCPIVAKRDFSPKPCPIGSYGSVQHAAGIWPKWEKTWREDLRFLHRLVWADLGMGHAENANKENKHCEDSCWLPWYT